jgi:hypothetical protein
MSKQKVKQVLAVIATWCPHCNPLSVENSKKLAAQLRSSYRILDIDAPEDASDADGLVRKYGDDGEDYLVPQIFLEYDDGKVQHVFTGFSESTELTKRHWEDLFQSSMIQGLVPAN